MPCCGCCGVKRLQDCKEVVAWITTKKAKKAKQRTTELRENYEILRKFENDDQRKNFFKDAGTDDATSSNGKSPRKKNDCCSCNLCEKALVKLIEWTCPHYKMSKPPDQNNCPQSFGRHCSSENIPLLDVSTGNRSAAYGSTPTQMPPEIKNKISCCLLVYWMALKWHIICFCLMISLTASDGGLVYMGYPFIVFQWAMITFPIPSLFFWIVAFLYTAILLIIRQIFPDRWMIVQDDHNIWRNLEGFHQQSCLSFGLHVALIVALVLQFGIMMSDVANMQEQGLGNEAGSDSNSDQHAIGQGQAAPDVIGSNTDHGANGQRQAAQDDIGSNTDHGANGQRQAAQDDIGSNSDHGANGQGQQVQDDIGSNSDHGANGQGQQVQDDIGSNSDHGANSQGQQVQDDIGSNSDHGANSQGQQVQDDIGSNSDHGANGQGQQVQDDIGSNSQRELEISFSMTKNKSLVPKTKMYDVTNVTNAYHKHARVLVLNSYNSEGLRGLLGADESRPGLARQESTCVKIYEKIPCLHCCTDLDSEPVSDWYPWMFLCQITAFAIFIGAYASFSQYNEGGNVFADAQENKVPWPFLVLAAIHSLFITVERVIYLKRWRIIKGLYHHIFVLIFQGLVFFVHPKFHRQSFSENYIVQAWYFVICCYSGFSACQLRCGYPKNVEGHFLTNGFELLRHLLFKTYEALPFVPEFRTLIGWWCTETCLNYDQWIQLEDIYANVYNAKYYSLKKKRDAERPNKWEKLYVGFITVVLNILIWGPLVWFCVTDSSEPSHPKEATLTLDIAGYQPLLACSAVTPHSLIRLNETQFDKLKEYYAKDKKATKFLNNYIAEDVTLTAIDGTSNSNWGISRDGLKNLKEDLLNRTLKGDLDLTIDIRFKRDPDSFHNEELWIPFTWNLALNSPTSREVRWNLTQLMNKSLNEPVRINHAFPRFLTLGKNSEITPVKELLEGKYGTGWSNVSLMFHSDWIGNTSSEWWSMEEAVLGNVSYYDPGAKTTWQPSVYFFTFNDRINTPSFSDNLSRIGLLAFYTSGVLLIHRLIRGGLTKHHATIMFREYENVEPLNRLVRGIYDLRQLKDLVLERQLYDLIISLYRDPELMKLFTQPKAKERVEQEINGSKDSDPQGSGTVGDMSINQGPQLEDSNEPRGAVGGQLETVAQLHSKEQERNKTV